MLEPLVPYPDGPSPPPDVEGFKKGKKAKTELSSKRKPPFNLDEDKLHFSSMDTFTNIFKKSKTGNKSLSKDDLIQADDELKKFLKRRGDSKSKSNSKTKTLQNANKSEEIILVEESVLKSKNHHPQIITPFLDSSMSTDDLLLQADALLKGTVAENESQPTTSGPSFSIVSPNKKRGSTRGRLNALGQRTNKTPILNFGEEIVISDTEEERAPIVPKRRTEKPKSKSKKRENKKSIEITLSSDDDESESEKFQSTSTDPPDCDLGKILLFQAEVESSKFPIRMYESQYVKDLRAVIAEKTEAIPESLQMFLGDFNQLEDNKTLAESGIGNLCTIEVYVLKKTSKELFEQGATSILRFKIQTGDRRGRQDCFVYVSKKDKMQVAVNQYSKDMGLNPTSIKLKFDGDYVDLLATPEDCDLEGDECLDLIICT